VLLGALLLVLLVSFWLGFRESLLRIWTTYSFSTDKEETRKDTWLTVAFLLICFIIGLGLRLYNLGGFPAYVDEYLHMSTAIGIIKGNPVEYFRAFLTVSLPVYLSYRIFGISLWAGRLPMVLINMLAIFPLYLLGRKINKGVGYLSVLLFMFSPWIIADSRTVRDYAVVPLFFYLAAVLLIDLLDWDRLSFMQV
jgi:predicted membrane-bound mannosyltransferase